MNRSRFGLMAAAVAATLATGPLTGGHIMRPEAPYVPLPARRRKRKRGVKKGHLPNAQSGRDARHADLNRGCSSTLEKVHRWYRANPSIVPHPTEKAKFRHAWYRRQVERAARAKLVAAEVL